MEKTYTVNVGPLEDVLVGQGLCFVIEGEEIAVFRARDGKVFAVSNRCPHRGGSLSDGIIGDGKVICPLHGHKFDLATGKGCEAGESLMVFDAWVEEGNVLIRYIPGFSTGIKSA
jgi:nitrite reductase (NADH) small subunit